MAGFHFFSGSKSVAKQINSLFEIKDKKQLGKAKYRHIFALFKNFLELMTEWSNSLYFIKE